MFMKRRGEEGRGRGGKEEVRGGVGRRKGEVRGEGERMGGGEVGREEGGEERRGECERRRGRRRRAWRKRKAKGRG